MVTSGDVGNNAAPSGGVFAGPVSRRDDVDQNASED